METDCKSVGSAFGGSNPSLPTSGGLAELGLMQGIANPPMYFKCIRWFKSNILRWEISLGVEHSTDNRKVAGSNPAFPT